MSVSLLDRIPVLPLTFNGRPTERLFAGIPVIIDARLPPGTAYLIPPQRPIDWGRAMKIDWRRAWQRGRHPMPQTDDMRQMLDDLAALSKSPAFR